MFCFRKSINFLCWSLIIFFFFISTISCPYTNYFHTNYLSISSWLSYQLSPPFSLSICSSASLFVNQSSRLPRDSLPSSLPSQPFSPVASPGPSPRDVLESLFLVMQNNEVCEELVCCVRRAHHAPSTRQVCLAVQPLHQAVDWVTLSYSNLHFFLGRWMDGYSYSVKRGRRIVIRYVCL